MARLIRVLVYEGPIDEIQDVLHRRGVKGSRSYNNMLIREAIIGDFIEPFDDTGPLHARIKELEECRPVWSKGYQDEAIVDGQLGRLWSLLGVTSQSDAIAKLEELKNA